MTAVSRDALADIARNLSACSTSRERARKVASYCAVYNVSRQALSKRLKQLGVTAGRKQRQDTGKRKFDEQLLAEIARVAIHATHTDKLEIPQSAARAIQIYEDSGRIAPGVLTPAYLNAWMREKKIDKRSVLEVTPHTQLATLHPNHVHVFDTSVCRQWYLSRKGTFSHQREGLDFYDNKPGSPRPKLVRYLLVDHASGAFFVWYAHEEKAFDLAEFLYYAWSVKDELARLNPGLMNHLVDPHGRTFSEVFPFCGLPKILQADRGAQIKASPTLRLLESLGIEYLPHMAENPRAKGSNERMQLVWEREFESSLKLRPAATLEQINAWAFDHQVRYQATKAMRRHGMPRFDIWNAYVNEHLVLPPSYEIYQNLCHSTDQERKVTGDGRVNFTPAFEVTWLNVRQTTWRVPRESGLHNHWVVVRVQFYEFRQTGSIRVRARDRQDAEWYTLAPIAINELGFPADAAVIGERYNAMPYTESQQAQAAMRIPTSGAASRHSLKRLLASTRSDESVASPDQATAHANAPQLPSTATAPAPVPVLSIQPVESVPAPVPTTDSSPLLIHGCGLAAVEPVSFIPRSAVTFEPITTEPETPTMLGATRTKMRILDALQLHAYELAVHQRAALDQTNMEVISINEIPAAAESIRQGKPYARNAAVVAAMHD